MGNCNSEKKQNSRKVNSQVSKEINPTNEKNLVGSSIRSKNEANKSLSNWEIASIIDSLLENLKYTSDESNVYLLPIDWFKQLANFIYSKGKTEINRNINNLSSINSPEVVSVLYEVMNEILKHFNADCVLKYDVSEVNNGIVNNTHSWKFVEVITVEEFKSKFKKLDNNRFEEVPDNIEKTFVKLSMIPDTELNRFNLDKKFQNDGMKYNNKESYIPQVRI